VTTIEVRDATDADADAACEVMRRSITELCIQDHHNDPQILKRWLANKHPEIFRSWLARTGNSVMVAVEGGRIVAVGAVTDGGDITLNYVSPDARFRGISRRLLIALEARAGQRGNTQCTLVSTATAQRFYLANGYAEVGPAQGHFGTNSGIPMRKALK
jgi:GNAT superfamily N-acetyltransferase